ncbi:MAG TPA: MFS transporter [Chloroflexota bacterium]|nr:MFS transporter [Chloroflexota bacterium]
MQPEVAQSSEAGAGGDPAGRRERLAWMLGFGIGSLAWNVCWPFLPLQVRAVGVGDLADVARLAGLLAGGTNLITALLGPLWSSLGERFGYRRQILRAHFGTALSMSLLGLARTPLALVGGGAALGALGGNYPHYMALVATRTPAAEVGRVVGDMQAAGQIGGTIGPLIGGVVAGELGLPAAFFASSLVGLSAIVVVALFVRPDAPARRGVAAAPARGSLRGAIARPEQRRLMLLLLVGDTAVQGLRPLIPVMIAARLSDPAAVAAATGLTTTLTTAGTVVAALVVGRLSRRVPPRRILMATLPAAVVAAALVPLPSDLPFLMAGWTLLGLSSGATVPAIFAWLGRIAPSSGGGFALLATTSMLCFAIGPILMGQATVYGLDAPFHLAAAATLVGALLVVVGAPRPLSAQAVG